MIPQVVSVNRAKAGRQLFSPVRMAKNEVVSEGYVRP